MCTKGLLVFCMQVATVYQTWELNTFHFHCVHFNSGNKDEKTQGVNVEPFVVRQVTTVQVFSIFIFWKKKLLHRKYRQ